MGINLVKDYYGRVNEGGASASRGFSYQDLCAVDFLFKYIDDEKFVSVTVPSLIIISLIVKRILNLKIKILII